MTPCPHGKMRFRDEISAKIALWNTRRKRDGGRQEIRWYYHRRCGAWHLTSQPKKDPAR